MGFDLTLTIVCIGPTEPALLAALALVLPLSVLLGVGMGRLIRRQASVPLRLLVACWVGFLTLAGLMVIESVLVWKLFAWLHDTEGSTSSVCFHFVSHVMLLPTLLAHAVAFFVSSRSPEAAQPVEPGRPTMQ